MFSLYVTLIVLFIGWRAYHSAKKSGTWSYKVFFGVLLATLLLCAIVTAPFFFVSPDTMQAHPGLFIISILLAIAAGVTLIAFYSNRWRKRELFKRSGKDQTLGIIIFILLFSIAGSAQTTSGNPENAPLGTDAKIQALEGACKAGVLTPVECEAKLAALTGGNQEKKQGSRRDEMPPHEEIIGGGCADTAYGCDRFYVYRARHFSLMIPSGWIVDPKEVCYGPAGSCPANSAGIKITHSTSWALVAPFPVAAKRPTDVVKNCGRRGSICLQAFQNHPE
jgi:hypothetical protein